MNLSHLTQAMDIGFAAARGEPLPHVGRASHGYRDIEVTVEREHGDHGLRITAIVRVPTDRETLEHAPSADVVSYDIEAIDLPEPVESMMVTAAMDAAIEEASDE